MSEPLLRAEALGVRAAQRALVQDLQLEIRRGEFVALLGCNGSGKSLLLHTLAGLRAPAAGRVCWQGRDAASLGRRALAQQLALLLQDQEEALNHTALESVLIGRHPHLDLWRSETARDRELALAALRAFGGEALASRVLATLSGGEQRRVALAAVLAQEPALFLLDEPGNHLDPQHQQLALQVIRARCDAGAACVASLHDASQADRYAERVLLLHGDGRWQCGPTRELLSAESLSAIFGLPMRALGAPGARAFIPA